MPSPSWRVAASAVLAAAMICGCAAASREAKPSPATQRLQPTTLSTATIRAQHDAAPPPTNTSQRIDHSHDWLYTNVQEFVEATDRRFAREDSEALAVPASPFRIGISTEFLDRSDGVEVNLDLDLDLTLRLPNLESRARLFLTSASIDEAPEVAGERTPVSAGFRYVAAYINFDVGVQADLPPNVFASVKWSRQVPVGGWDMYPFVKLFAETDDGIGYAGALTFDRWSGLFLFRSSSYLRWLNDENEKSWTQSFIFARAEELIVPDRYGSYVRATDMGKGFAVRLLAQGDNTSSANYYEASITFKRPTRSKWLYWFIEPLLRWDKDYNWSADPGIRIGVDALFWDLARADRTE